MTQDSFCIVHASEECTRMCNGILELLLQKSSWAGWGVKTFSELMQEKRQQRLGTKSDDIKNNDSDKSSEQQSNRNKKFTPIVFDEDDKQNRTNKVITTKRKFTPVVFDLDDKKEPKKPITKKFKPIIFEDTVEAPESVAKKNTLKNQPG